MQNHWKPSKNHWKTIIGKCTCRNKIRKLYPLTKVITLNWNRFFFLPWCNNNFFFLHELLSQSQKQDLSHLMQLRAFLRDPQLKQTLFHFCPFFSFRNIFYSNTVRLSLNFRKFKHISIFIKSIKRFQIQISKCLVYNVRTNLFENFMAPIFKISL